MPTPQAWQAPPVPALPGGHPEQAVSPGDTCCPSGHGVQSSAASCALALVPFAKVPDLHTEQALWPVWSVNVLTGQTRDSLPSV